MQSTEEILSSQIPEYEDDTQAQPTPQEPVNEAASYLGQRLTRNVGNYDKSARREEDRKEIIEKQNLGRVGEKIGARAEIREGWMEVDRNLLGARNIFYPEDWIFRIKPAEVEAIRNWSTIDNENPNSIDDVFNEIIRTCVRIVTPRGNVTWGSINSWDRFWFLMMVHDYTFKNGEGKFEFTEECPNCDHEVTYKLEAMQLAYDMPDADLMKYYNPEEQAWYIDPAEYGIEGEDIIKLYLPTLEKDAVVKSWMIQKVQQKKKFDNVFIKFASWLMPKYSKDEKIAEQQIKKAEMIYRGWKPDMFSFMDSVIKNITVMPQEYLTQVCDNCGEETTAQIRFPNGISSLFDISNKFRKFGSK